MPAMPNTYLVNITFVEFSRITLFHVAHSLSIDKHTSVAWHVVSLPTSWTWFALYVHYYLVQLQNILQTKLHIAIHAWLN